MSDETHAGFQEVRHDPTTRPVICNRRIDGIQAIIAALAIVAGIVTAALLITIIVIGLNDGNEESIIFSPHRKCSNLGKMMLEVGGNIFDAGISVAVCCSILNPEVAGIMGGGLSFHTNMKEASSKSRYTEFLPVINKDAAEMDPIPGNIVGLYQMGRRGRIKWPQLIKQTVTAVRGWKTSDGSPEVKQSEDFWKFYEGLAEYGEEFYSSIGLKFRNTIFETDKVWWTQVDLDDYLRDQGSHTGEAVQIHTRNLKPDVTIETMIGPTSGMELMQMYTLYNMTGRKFTPEMLKYAKQSHFDHIEDEKSRFLGDTAQVTEYDTYKLFINPNHIEQTKKKPVLRQAFDTSCVSSIQIMTDGQSLIILQTMGEKSRVKDSKIPGIKVPGYDNSTQLFHFPKGASKPDRSDERRVRTRPLLPFSPIFVRPKCGVCGLQASIGLATMHDAKSPVQLPFTMQLQALLNRQNSNFTGLITSTVDGTKKVILTRDPMDGINATALGFDEVRVEKELHSLPVVLSHTAGYGTPDKFGGFVVGEPHVQHQQNLFVNSV